MADAVKVLFVSSAAKDTGASDATNGVFALLKANLKAGLTVNGSGHIEARNDSGTVGGTGIQNWSWPDEVIGGKYALPLPGANLCSDFAALLDGLDSLATPPNGMSLPTAAAVTPEDPHFSFCFGGQDYYSEENLYINRLRHSSDNKGTTGSVFFNDLISAGDIDSNGDIAVITNGNIQELALAWDFEAEGSAFESVEYTILYDGAGNFEARNFGAIGAQTGSGSGATANVDADATTRTGYIRSTSAPVQNRAFVRSDLVDVFQAGLDFNPFVTAAYRHARIVRMMGIHNTNGSPVTALSQMPARSYNGSWAWNNLGLYPYFGPPLDVLIELANIHNADLHICIPHGLVDADIATMMGTIDSGLASHLVAFIELSNEAWNTSLASGVNYEHFQAIGFDIWNKAALAAGDASSGYTAGDEVTGSGWTVTIDTVSAGVPTAMTVTGRSSPSSSSNVSMTGGTGTGLVLDFTQYTGAQDFPSWRAYGFRMAEVADIIRTAVGSDFGTRFRVLFGGQTAGASKWAAHWLPGFTDWADGITGHPDYPPAGATNDAVADLFHGITITNYYGGPPNMSNLDTWIAAGQETVNTNLSASAQGAITTVTGWIAEWVAIAGPLGLPLIGYEGGSHMDLNGQDTPARAAAMAAYHVSATGIQDRKDVYDACIAEGMDALSHFVGIDTAIEGKPWAFMDHPGDFDDPRLVATLEVNEANPGSTWDTGRNSGFGVGQYFGIAGIDGATGADSTTLLIGGAMSIIQGDESNVGVLAAEGIATSLDQILLPGAQADYTVSTGPNGCKQLKRSGETIGARLHPTKITSVRFEGAFTKVAVGSL